MKELVGAGGWGYFKAKGMDPLKAYSSAFNYVEVNSTFYDYPDAKTVRAWRERVPQDFEFSVRCHRDLTHNFRMEPSEGSKQCIAKMVEICRTLRANILLLQTPESFEIGEREAEGIGDLISDVELQGVLLAWEVRNEASRNSREVIDLMQDNNIVQVVDLSREMPAYDSEMVYTRLFGQGNHNVYQFTDEELEQIRERAAELGVKRAYYTLHGVRMYRDAARLKTFVETGEFPKVTKSTGLGSLQEVLREDARFPCDKRTLIESQGWKLIDLTDGKRVRAGDLLQKLPERTFKDPGSVVQALKGVVR